MADQLRMWLYGLCLISNSTISKDKRPKLYFNLMHESKIQLKFCSKNFFYSSIGLLYFHIIYFPLILLLIFKTGAGPFLLSDFPPICSCVSSYNVEAAKHRVRIVRFLSDLVRFLLSNIFVPKFLSA